MESRGDAELVVLSQRGDPEAFNELARHWQGALFRFTRRLLGDGEEARDVCQATLLRAYEGLPRLRDPGKFKAWIHLIALNLCRDRKRSPRARLEIEPLEEGTLPGGALPAQPWERARLAETLDAVLARISAEQRTAILLREYQGFSTEEIAEMTGVPVATVRTRIFYGFKAVRAMLRAQGIEGAGT